MEVLQEIVVFKELIILKSTFKRGLIVMYCIRWRERTERRCFNGRPGPWKEAWVLNQAGGVSWSNSPEGKKKKEASKHVWTERCQQKCQLACCLWNSAWIVKLCDWKKQRVVLNLFRRSDTWKGLRCQLKFTQWNSEIVEVLCWQFVIKFQLSTEENCVHCKHFQLVYNDWQWLKCQMKCKVTIA